MALQLVNCKKCGKLFLRVKNICEDCYREQEEDFKKVVDYLRDEPGSSVSEISEATKVSIGQIREFILAGRILASNYKNLSYPCESCGMAIQTGKLCTNCTNNIQKLAKKVENVTTYHENEKKAKSGGYISRNL